MKKQLAIMMAFILSLVFLSGCGKEQPVSATPSDIEPIQIGVLTVLTGDFATLGTTCYKSMEIALEEVNAAGGIQGRPVEFVTLDTTGDPTECVELARQLIEDDKICSILGPVRGGVEGFTACPVTNEEGLVTVLPICSISDFCKMGDYVFSMAGKQSYEMPHLVNAVLKDIANAKTVAVIYKNNEWGVSSVDALTATCEDVGIEVVGLEPYAESETDFTTVLTKLRQTNPDTIVLVSEAVDGAAILTQMQQLGWNDIVKVGVGSTYSEQLLSFASKDAAEGLLTTAAYFVSEDDPKGFAYTKEFEKRAGYAPTVHGPLSYDAVVMLCAAIEKAGSTDRTAIKDALFALKDVEGIAGSYTFTEDGDILRDYSVIKVEKNEFVRYTK